MTQDEFAHRYHEFSGTKEQAEAEAKSANAEGIDGDTAVAVDFGPAGCAVMLKSACEFLKSIDAFPGAAL